MTIKQIVRNHLFFIILSGLIITLFAGLGTWQMMRYKQKTAFVDMVEHQLTLPAEKLETFLAEGLPLEDYKFRKVIVSGTLDVNHINYHEAQVRDGKLGVNIIVPLKIEGGTVILINLGWINKSDKGKIKLTEQPIAIEGYLKISDRPNRFTPKNKFSNQQLYYIDIRDVAKNYNIATILPVYLMATQSNPMNDSIRPNEAIIHFQNIHLSYAITWYALGITWIILVWLYQRRKYLKRVNIPLLNELTPLEKIDSK